MSRALYDRIAAAYAEQRRPDKRLAAHIDTALGACESVLNVGAGTGAYEPRDRMVVAVEPSLQMIRRRPPGPALAVRALAGRLPFEDQSFDAALAILTVHHWANRHEGLAELRRIARDRVVILTWDPEHSGFWLVQDYLPEILRIDRQIFPPLQEIERAIGSVIVEPVPVPADCFDGFLGAFWCRPAAYLNARVRAAISAFSRVDWALGVDRLRRDLEDGSWHQRNGALLNQSQLDIGYRLVVARYA